MNGYIYLTTNLVTGKQYVGQRAGNFCPHYLGSGVFLKQSIKKYGRQSFRVTMLAECDSKNDRNEAEIDFIAIFRFYGARLYNMLSGGQGQDSGAAHPCFGKKFIFSEIHKSRLKLSASKRLGVPLAPDVIQKLRDSQKGENGNFYGKKHTPDVIAGISARKKGVKLTKEQISRRQATRAYNKANPNAKIKVTRSGNYVLV